MLHIPEIEGVSAHAVGYMDFKMAREAGAEFSDMGAVHHPSIIRGVISRHQFGETT